MCDGAEDCDNGADENLSTCDPTGKMEPKLNVCIVRE